MLDRLNLEKAEEARTVRLPDACREEMAEDRKIVIRTGTEGGSFCITVDNTYSERHAALYERRRAGVHKA